jgi:hypothetical protein
MATGSPAGRAMRAAVERTGRGRNPVTRRRSARSGDPGSRQRSGRAVRPPEGGA